MEKDLYRRLEILKACQDKGIFVYSVKERLEMNDSMQAKIMSTFLALFSELERFRHIEA